MTERVNSRDITKQITPQLEAPRSHYSATLRKTGGEVGYFGHLYFASVKGRQRVIQESNVENQKVEKRVF